LEEGRLGFLGEMEDMQLDIQVPEEDKEQRAIQQKEEDKEQEDRLGSDQEDMELVGIQEVLQMVLVGIRGGRQLLVGMAKEQRRKGSEEQLDRKADTVSQTSFKEPCLL